MATTDLNDALTIQDNEHLSENDFPDTIERLYIESPAITQTRFREAIQRLIVEENIRALNRLFGSTLLDTQVLAADMGENELQSYMAGYKTGWSEASELIKDHIAELQASLNTNKDGSE